MKTHKYALFPLVLLVVFFFAAVGTTPAYAASEGTPPPIPTTGDIWDGSIEQPETLVQRDGVYYYEITKCSQLAYVAQTGGDWLTYNYILGNDLILNDVVLTWDEEGNCTNTEELLEWAPIGDGHPGFSGVFLGNGYTISGMYIPNGYTVGLFSWLSGEVSNLTIVNGYVSGRNWVGGLAGIAQGRSHSLTNCSFSGAVCGSSSDIRSYLGGLVGYLETMIQGSNNYADVFGTGYIGGIAGNADDGIKNCCNYGMVYGEDSIGGIVGYMKFSEVSGCGNYGTVYGKNDVGGIIGNGNGRKTINSYNVGTVIGEKNVGGIVGNNYNNNVSFCYNAGIIKSSASAGTIIGNSDHFLGNRSEIQNCYYLKDASIALNPFGNVSGDTPGVAEGFTDAQMKQQSSFTNWDFDQTWSIDHTKNGGYPYLSWQNPGAIPVNGVSLNKEVLSLAVGDQEYLTATVSPVTADSSSCVWTSSNDQVASVSQTGKVTAIAPGSAEISVTTQDGGYTAVCTVTVLGRTQNEYRINSITLRDFNGEPLRQIPVGSFWASVSITNQSSTGDTLVLLASYDTNGRYLDMMCAQAKDLLVGATIELSFLMKNSNAQVSNVKAFSISSLADLSPLSEAVSWQPTDSE